MVSTGTKITLPFVVVATLLWYLSLGSVETWVSWAILVGVGVLAPTILTESDRFAAK
ncbi:hypothetical protein [Halobellus litoreus]|uniref:Uncharacterized protein n=1 Tax=Halobellus litoreus TaxID=755310 RepID=A0ABD6E165_9EURY|nr:hypothetical protein [Halobellus litoreus]